MNDEVFDELAGKAISNLSSFFDGGFENKEDMLAARLAATVLSSWTRHKQTQGAREAVRFSMARELAADSERLAEYMRITMPESPVTKALPVGN